MVFKQFSRALLQSEPQGEVIEIKLMHRNRDSSRKLPDLLFGIGLGVRNPDLTKLKNKLAPNPGRAIHPNKGWEIHLYHDGERSFYYATDEGGEVMQLGLIDGKP